MRSFGRLVVVISLALGGTLDSAAARADEPAVDAAQFFRAGRAAYERKEYRAAALAFLEAYRRAPRAAAAYNAGRAWEAAGEPELGADAFARALEGELGPEDTAYARARLETHRELFARVDVVAPAGGVVFVRGAERGAIPTTVHLAPGAHEIRVRRRDGSEVARTLTLARAGERVELALEDTPPPPSAPPPKPSPAPPKAAPLPPPERATPVFAWASLAGAGALGVAGAYTYSRFANARSSFESSGSHDGSTRDDAQRWRTWTYALWGSAAALGVTAAILFVADGRDRSRTTAVLRLAPTGASVALTF